MGGSRIKGRILDAAIQLFGKFGFEGVTTRRIAGMAKCMEGGIYRLYGDKVRLYEEAVATVVEAALNSMATFALGLYTETSGRDQADAVKAAAHRWYSSISRDGARLLQQVLLNDKPRKQQAKQPFACVLAILQKTLEASENARDGFDAKTRTESLIWALFQLKLNYAGPAEKEEQEVDRFLQDWLQTLPVSDKPGYSDPDREFPRSRKARK
jgi:AcrR family transcriptional regulator